MHIKALNVLGIACLANLFAVPITLGKEAECCAKIELEISSKRTPEKDIILRVNLANKGGVSLRFPNGFGPWDGGIGRSQLNFIATRLPTNTPIINRARALTNPAPGDIEVKAGESIAEDVIFRDLFPEAVAEIKSGKGDVVVFWTYQLVVGGKPLSERVGGWIFFPKDYLK